MAIAAVLSGIAALGGEFFASLREHASLLGIGEVLR